MKVGDEVYLKHNPSMKGVIHSGSGHLICVDWANGVSDTHWGSSLILASEYENLKEPKGHPNASILMEIAKEAAVNPEYWKEFQWYHDIDKIWHSCNTEESLLIAVYEVREFPNQIVRRKPRTIRIGNYDVPERENRNIWIDSNHKNIVNVACDDTGQAELMLKALQELLGAKK